MSEVSELNSNLHTKQQKDFKQNTNASQRSPQNAPSNPCYNGCMWVPLVIICLLGFVLRLHNLSPFLLYPDSYQNLIVAKNIIDYHSVVGYLGTHGMVYPDYFMWTRPIYPLLICFFSLFSTDLQTVAQLVSFVMGIASLPLVFLFLSSLWQSKKAGLAGAFLFALSFNHTVWSGFVMTETTGVFFLLLFLWLLARLSTKNGTGKQSVLTGIVFSLGILTRYEYIFLLLAVSILMLAHKRRFGIFIVSVLLSLSSIGFLLFPPQTFQIIWEQQTKMLTVGFIGIAGIVLFALAGKRIGLANSMSQKLQTILLRSVITFIICFPLYLLLQYLIGPRVSLFYDTFAASRSFLVHELLLVFFGIIGFVTMLRKKEHRTFAYFMFACVVLLGLVYNIVNPEMERYMTHLVPLLIIPASYGLVWSYTFFEKKQLRWRLIAFCFFLGFVAYQLVTTYHGLRYLNDPSWFHPSYEEQSAKFLKPHLKPGDILLVALPEPYYFFTGVSTVSLTDTKPFLYLPKSLDNDSVVVVADAGMRTYFPSFDTFITKKIGSYKILSYPIVDKFHYSDKDRNDSKKNIIYRLKLGTIRQKIASY